MARQNSSATTQPSLDEQLKQVKDAAVAGATEEDIAAIEQVEVSAEEVSAEEIVKRAKEALALLEMQQQRSEKTLKKKEEELDYTLQTVIEV